MRTLAKLAVAFGLTICLSSAANAQGPGGRGMGGGGGINLLTNKSVQKELKLTDEQIEKATKAATEMREKMTEKRQELQGLEGEEMAAIQKEMGVESKKLTDAILKPEQTKRLEQITLQQSGFRAFATPDVQSKLKFNDEQKNKIKDLSDEAQGQMRELFQSAQGGGDRAEMMKKMTELNKQNNEKALAVLTAEQKKAWKELTGEPFTIVQEQGRRPGGN